MKKLNLAAFGCGLVAITVATGAAPAGAAMVAETGPANARTITFTAHDGEQNFLRVANLGTRIQIEDTGHKIFDPGRIKIVDGDGPDQFAGCQLANARNDRIDCPLKGVALFRVLLGDVGDHMDETGLSNGYGVPVRTWVTAGQGNDHVEVPGGNKAQGENLLEGGTGEDELYGGPSNDRFVGGPGPDTVIGNWLGSGPAGDADTVDYSDHAGGVSIALGPNGTETVGNGNPGADGVTGVDGKLVMDAIAGVENIVGSPGSDFITGNDSANTIRTLGGASSLDIADARGGNDYLLGDSGTDVLNGGNGDDTAIGYGGFDQVTGGPGNDTLADLGGGARLIALDGTGGDTIYCDDGGVQNVLRNPGDALNTSLGACETDAVLPG